MTIVSKELYYEYVGPQCEFCGRENYEIIYVCIRCDDLICGNCLDKHNARHFN